MISRLKQALTPYSPADQTSSTPNELEAMLLWLDQFGAVTLRRNTSQAGWSCSIDMHTTAAGARFDIGSDYGLPTPTAGTQQCIDRVKAALRDVGVAR